MLKKKSKIKKSRKGFTLVEILLYIAIASIFIFTISTLAFSLVRARERTQVIIEVNENGMMIMNKITQTVRNSVSITTPAEGLTTPNLVLVVDDSAKSPTTFDMASTNLRMKEGITPTVNLTSSKVDVDNLSITNLSRTGTKGSIRIQFRLTYINTSGRAEYSYFKDFVGSASLK